MKNLNTILTGAAITTALLCNDTIVSLVILNIFAAVLVVRIVGGAFSHEKEEVYVKDWNK